MLQGGGGVAAGLPDLGGVQRAAASHILAPVTRKGTPTVPLCYYSAMASSNSMFSETNVVKGIGYVM